MLTEYDLLTHKYELLLTRYKKLAEQYEDLLFNYETIFLENRNMACKLTKIKDSLKDIVIE